MLKADLHIHTEYSMDCETPLTEVLARCQELDINCIAIADHGTCEGALKMQQLAPFKVIVAEEVLTPQGEIMGMFLKETIPSRQPLADVIQQIKAQGGLVCVQHPFDTMFRPGLGEKILEKIVEDIDLVEVFNARSPRALNSQKSIEFARLHNLPQGAGSDAHTVAEIGNAFVFMPEFEGQTSFLESLRQGKIDGQLSGPMVHFQGISKKIKKLFTQEK